MRIENECACCGSIYTIVFTYIEDNLDWPDDAENQQGETDIPEPKFCAFCGHDLDADPTDFDK